jgi:carboxymethylenebutenolidase
MKKNHLIIVMATAVAAGVYFSMPGTMPEKKTPPPAPNTNAQALESGKQVDIVTEDAVEYFPGAKGYFAKPASGSNHPGVVMIHENRGLNNGVRMMARDLAKEGYAVLAVDLLGKSVETQEEARGLTANFDQAKGLENLRAAAAWLRERGSGKVASLGWCFGGGQSLQLALSGEKMDATIIYYGRLVTEEEKLSAIQWPVLGIFGDKDTGITVESVNQFDAALDKVGVPNEIHMYPGVGHAFANPSGANYAPEPTKDAWTKTVNFLRANIGQ